MKAILKTILPRVIQAAMYRRQALAYLGSLPAPTRTDHPTIVFFNHFFDQDVRALGYCQEQFNHIVVNAPYLFRSAKLFFRESVRKLLAPYDSESEANRMAYRAECRILMDTIVARFRPAAIVLTADNFYWVREVIVLAKEAGIKVIVVDKEGVVTPHYYEAGAERYRAFAPFVSDHIFVYSDRQKAYWTKAGASLDHISIIGQPRSDLFYREAYRQVDSQFEKPQPLVTLFSWEDDAYITMLQKGERRTWAEMKREAHDRVYQFAGRFENYNFVIKTHPQQSDLAELTARYSGLPNLRVIGGSAVANELIQRSELIVAFQTTSVIEAMFLDKRVIYTAWDTNYPRFAPDILPLHEAPGIQIAHTLGEFDSLCDDFFHDRLARFELNDSDRAAREQFVNTYLYRPDGNVARRFEQGLIRVLA